MKCGEASETRFGQVSGQSEPSSGGKRPIKVREHFRDFNLFGLEKSNVENRLKRVLPKFHADWSHPRGVNGRLKISLPTRVGSGFDLCRRYCLRYLEV